MNEFLHLKDKLPLPVSGIILCGGASSRMGTDKAFLPYNGTTLIEHQLEIMQEIFCEVFLVTNTPESFNHLSANVVKDIVPSRGPLVGILSGLLVSVCDYSFVSPCDTPLVDHNIILSLVTRRRDSDILLYQWNNHIEPLIGVYSKRCASKLERIVFGQVPDNDDALAGLAKDTIDFALRRPSVIAPHFSVDTPGDFGKIASLPRPASLITGLA